jgi:SAM-dependent methyltransferase
MSRTGPSCDVAVGYECVPAALQELDRVLVPGGRAGLVWNLRDLWERWQRELDALLAGLRGDAPHSRDGRWQAAVAGSAFRIAHQEHWSFVRETDVDGVVDRVLSVSYVAALDDEGRAQVSDAVRALLGDVDRVTFGYVTEGYVLAR